MILQIGQRATENGEILRKHIGHAAVDRAPAGDHAVARRPVGFHAEIGAAMGDEHVEFLERAFVEQKLDPFARCQLALGMLGLDAALAAAGARHAAAGLKLGQNVLHRRLPSRCRTWRSRKSARP
jgi:hypothetical protein